MIFHCGLKRVYFRLYQGQQQIPISRLARVIQFKKVCCVKSLQGMVFRQHEKGFGTVWDMLRLWSLGHSRTIEQSSALRPVTIAQCTSRFSQLETVCHYVSFVIHTTNQVEWYSNLKQPHTQSLVSIDRTETCSRTCQPWTKHLFVFSFFFSFFDPRWKRWRILALFGPFWRPFFFRPSCAWHFPLRPRCHAPCGWRWKPLTLAERLAFRRPIHKACRIAFGNGVDNVFDIKLWEKKMMDPASSWSMACS